MMNKERNRKSLRKDTLLMEFASLVQIIGFWVRVATKEELIFINNNLAVIHNYMKERREK